MRAGLVNRLSGANGVLARGGVMTDRKLDLAPVIRFSTMRLTVGAESTFVRNRLKVRLSSIAIRMDWPGNHHINAAIGWLELGNSTEAWTELECLSVEHRALPDALAVEWRLLAAEQRWQEAICIAESWVEVAPETPDAWIERSFALHELRQTQSAWDKLLPAATLFPKTSTISYNLACYACQLGNMEAARRWMRHTLLTLKNERERQHWVSAAQSDVDLRPLWKELGSGDLA